LALKKTNMALNLKKRLVLGRELTYEEVDGNWTDIEAAIANRAPLTHTHAISAITGLQAALDSFIPLSQKAANSGVAPLDVNGKVPLVHLPDLGATANDMIFPTESITSADVGKIATFKNGLAQLPTFVAEAAQEVRFLVKTALNTLNNTAAELNVTIGSGIADGAQLIFKMYRLGDSTKTTYTITFKDTPSGTYDVQIGATAADTATNLYNFLDSSFPDAILHPMYTFLNPTTAVVRIQAYFYDVNDSDFYEESVTGDLTATAANADFTELGFYVPQVIMQVFGVPNAETYFQEEGEASPPYYLSPLSDDVFSIAVDALQIATVLDVAFKTEWGEIFGCQRVLDGGDEYLVMQVPYNKDFSAFTWVDQDENDFVAYMDQMLDEVEEIEAGNPPYNDAPILGQITAVVGSNVYISSQPIRSYLLKGENSVGFEPDLPVGLPGLSLGRLLLLDHENAGFVRSIIDYGLGPWSLRQSQYGFCQALGAADPDEEVLASFSNSTGLLTFLASS
jgi:hypothetical protein